MPLVETQNLRLVPLSAACLRASLQGERAALAELLGASVPAIWPDEPEILEMRLRQIERDPELESWGLHAIVDPRQRAMIGHIGFHTLPGHESLAEICPGGVEIGYTVFREYRRRGVASAAIRALVGAARAERWVERVVACVGVKNEPSLALAAKLGFVRLGSHIDEDDGPELIFEIPATC